MRRLSFLFLLCGAVFAQTYTTVTIAPNAAASAVGQIRFVEKSNSPSRNYLAFEGPDSLAGDVRYKWDGTAVAGCVTLGAAVAGVNTLSTAPCATGTVTSISTTSPISGGTITSTGTISCPTCLTSTGGWTAGGNNIFTGNVEWYDGVNIYAMGMSATHLFIVGPASIISAEFQAGVAPGITVANLISSASAKLSYITGSTQCLQVNSSGFISGTGGACGGSVTSIATTSPISGGTITSTGTISCPTCLTSTGGWTAGGNNIFTGNVEWFDGVNIYAMGMSATHLFIVGPASVISAEFQAGVAPGITVANLISSASAKLSYITGSTQCLEVNSSGFISGAGAACGAGTVTSIATSSPISGGTITGTGTISCPTCLTTAGGWTAGGNNIFTGNVEWFDGVNTYSMGLSGGHLFILGPVATTALEIQAGIAAGITTPNLVASSTAKLSFITGSTQCLEVNSSGYISGAGAACSTFSRVHSQHYSSRSSAIGTTTITLPSAGGIFTIGIHAMTTSTGSGTASVTVNWTEDGVGCTYTLGSMSLISSTNRLVTALTVHADAGTNITYSTSYSSTGSYSLDITADGIV